MLTKVDNMRNTNLRPVGYTMSSVRVRASSMAFCTASSSSCEAAGLASGWGMGWFEPSNGGLAAWLGFEARLKKGILFVGGQDILLWKMRGKERLVMPGVGC